MQLTNKVAIITGAASGIGLAIAKTFAAQGAKIVAGDWNNERLEAAVAAIRATGAEIVGVQGDISKKEDAEALVETALQTYGRVDILCNNAGIMDYMAGVGNVTDDIWRRVMAINVDGPMYTMRRAIAPMLEQGGGAIINIASVASVTGAAAGAAYTASKHAVIGLTTNTAWMYAPQMIRCNAICPGGTRTNIAETMPMDRLDREGAARLAEFSKLNPRTLEPEDIAAIALLLASDAGRNISGAVITADGGWMAA